MDSGTVLQLMFAMFIIAAKIAAPLLLTGLVIGILISLFQAVTSLNDSTLNFLPKVIAVALALWLTLPWLLQQMVAYTTQIFTMMERVPR